MTTIEYEIEKAYRLTERLALTHGDAPVSPEQVEELSAAIDLEMLGIEG